MIDWAWIPAYVIGSAVIYILVGLFVYGLARLISIAYYRTKAEYFRTMIKEGESEHGKE